MKIQKDMLWMAFSQGQVMHILALLFSPPLLTSSQLDLSDKWCLLTEVMNVLIKLQTHWSQKSSFFFVKEFSFDD